MTREELEAIKRCWADLESMTNMPLLTVVRIRHDLNALVAEVEKLRGILELHIIPVLDVTAEESKAQIKARCKRVVSDIREALGEE
jgi:hypothetical protein